MRCPALHRRPAAQARCKKKKKKKQMEPEELPAEALLVGAHPSVGPPKFPPDHSIVSKGVPPSQKKPKAGRPCFHCGADHWDNECSHSPYQIQKKLHKTQWKKNFAGKGKGKGKGKSRRPPYKYDSKYKRKAQVHFANIEDPDAYAAFVAYEQAYLSACEDSDDDSSCSESESGSEQPGPEDF